MDILVSHAVTLLHRHIVYPSDAAVGMQLDKRVNSDATVGDPV